MAKEGPRSRISSGVDRPWSSLEGIFEGDWEVRINQTLEKRMKAVEALGRGCFYEEAEEGGVIFSTDTENGRLDIYLDGFSFVGNNCTGMKAGRVAGD